MPENNNDCQLSKTEFRAMLIEEIKNQKKRKFMLVLELEEAQRRIEQAEFMLQGYVEGKE